MKWTGRPKHLYSIYRKMVIQNKPFDQIYDLIAIRVLVDTVPDCYTVLGIVPHAVERRCPAASRIIFRVPKDNMYQSPAHHGDRRAAHSLPL